MSKTTKTVSTHEGICAVCFGTFKLDNGTEKPTYHGFKAFNIHHGQTGGWHSGQCHGGTFPHYGASCEGTKWALNHTTNYRDALVKRIEEHAAKPALIWFRQPSSSRRYGSQGKTVQFTVNQGDVERTLDRDESAGFPWQDTLPSYDQLWKRTQGLLTAELEATNKHITFLQGKINTWKLTPAAPVVPHKVVHLAALWKGGRYGQHKVGKCQMWGLHQPKPAKEGSLTEDKSKVTCQRCAKAV